MAQEFSQIELTHGTKGVPVDFKEACVQRGYWAAFCRYRTELTAGGSKPVNSQRVAISEFKKAMANDVPPSILIRERAKRRALKLLDSGVTKGDVKKIEKPCTMVESLLFVSTHLRTKNITLKDCPDGRTYNLLLDFQELDPISRKDFWKDLVGKILAKELKSEAEKDPNHYDGVELVDTIEEMRALAQEAAA